MNYSKLKNEIILTGSTIPKIAKQIGMTESGFYQAIKNDTLKVRDLEKIAKILNLSVGYFFDDDCKDTESKKIIGDGNHVITVSGSNNNNSSASAELKECKKELEYFKILLQEKDARIEELKEMVEYLKGK